MPVLPASDWDDIVGHVRVNHPDLARGWFVRLIPITLLGGVLKIRAGNPMQVRYLEDHCRLAFGEAAQATLGQLVATTFESEPANDKDDATGAGLSAFENNNGQLRLNDDYTFENFVVGPGNRLAHAASVAVAELPGKSYNPLFIHGDVGLGKTHLLQAICHACNELSTSSTAMYISCETFANHFIEAVQGGALTQFRYRYRHVDMLVIDDIQFLGERERSQEEFFHTFNTLYQAQKQIILSADSSPTEIPSLENRLVSRFKSGLVASIDLPCLETRMAIIRQKSQLRCIEVPEDVVAFVATQIESSIRDLEGALVRLDAVSQTRGGKIDLDLAQEALGAEVPQYAITVQRIVDAVTKYFRVRLADLQSKKRTKSITQPRQICMYLARQLTNHSLEEIGGFFGGRDHTTVLHASRTIDKMKTQDTQLSNTIEDITTMVRNNRAD